MQERSWQCLWDPKPEFFAALFNSSETIHENQDATRTLLAPNREKDFVKQEPRVMFGIHNLVLLKRTGGAQVGRKWWCLQVGAWELSPKLKFSSQSWNALVIFKALSSNLLIYTYIEAPLAPELGGVCKLQRLTVLLPSCASFPHKSHVPSHPCAMHMQNLF